jgi:hypothetical protein
LDFKKRKEDGINLRSLAEVEGGTDQVNIHESSTHVSSSFVIGALHRKWGETLKQGLVGGLVWRCNLQVKTKDTKPFKHGAPLLCGFGFTDI